MSGRRHLSKSTSELSSPRSDNEDHYGRDTVEMRPQSAAPPETTHMSVVQKAHSFLSQLKVRKVFPQRRKLLHIYFPL